MPCAYSFAEYSLVSTVLDVSVAHSFAAPFDAVSVTPVPPIAQAFAEPSEDATTASVLVAQSLELPMLLAVSLAHAFAE